MNKEKMAGLINNFDKLSIELDIGEDHWFQLVDYHFDCLSNQNNGNILSFLAPNNGNGCVSRYLEEIWNSNYPLLAASQVQWLLRVS